MLRFYEHCARLEKSFKNLDEVINKAWQRSHTNLIYCFSDYADIILADLSQQKISYCLFSPFKIILKHMYMYMYVCIYIYSFDVSYVIYELSY